MKILQIGQEGSVKYTKQMFLGDLAFVIGIIDGVIYREEHSLFKTKTKINKQRFEQFKGYCRKNFGMELI